MSFTNIFYDKDRVSKNLNQNLENLQYMTQVPGNGTKPYFIDDPQIRLQKFGANISNNIVDLNSTLLGLNKIQSNCNEMKDINTERGGNNNLTKEFDIKNFPVYSYAITDESRLMMPAWTLRDMENQNWINMTHQKLNNIEMKFSNNVSSRILEKDKFEKNC